MEVGQWPPHHLAPLPPLLTPTSSLGQRQASGWSASWEVPPLGRRQVVWGLWKCGSWGLIHDFAVRGVACFLLGGLISPRLGAVRFEDPIGTGPGAEPVNNTRQPLSEPPTWLTATCFLAEPSPGISCRE